MPYFITDESADCSGWATVKDDGEVMGCHQTKQDAIDQMVALSIEEGIEPGGERSATRDLPEAYRPALSPDVPEGRACGNCLHYDETDIQGDMAWCHQWEEYVRGDYYCDRWAPVQIGGRSTRQVDLALPGYISDAAARGLELNAEGHGGDGLTDKTLREARAMAAGDITEDKVIRANAWGSRHAGSLDATQNSDSDDPDWPGAGAVAHYLWGIDPLDPEPARSWFARKAEQIQAERTQTMGEHDIRRPVDDIVRHIEFRAAKSADGLTLDGYGAVFDQWTDIDDYMGSYRERIAPGAFKRTLGQRMPVLQFDHGTHPLIGSIPLGRITSITEDAHGLRVKAKLSDNWLVQPVRDAIRDGGITGMSFRFRIIDEEWSKSRTDGVEERTIREVELYEVGPVVFPAYEQTSVGVRSRQALGLLQDPEVRSEIARIMATGTDIESLAATDDPADSHSSDIEDPAAGHVSIPTRSQRIARLQLAGITHKE